MCGMGGQSFQLDSINSTVQSTTAGQAGVSTPGEDDLALHSQMSTYTTPGSTMGEVTYIIFSRAQSHTNEVISQGASNSNIYFQSMGTAYNVSFALGPVELRMTQLLTVYIYRDAILGSFLPRMLLRRSVLRPNLYRFQGLRSNPPVVPAANLEREGSHLRGITMVASRNHSQSSVGKIQLSSSLMWQHFPRDLLGFVVQRQP